MDMFEKVAQFLWEISLMFDFRVPWFPTFFLFRIKSAHFPTLEVSSMLCLVSYIDLVMNKHRGIVTSH